MNKSFLAIIILAATVLISCETDIDANAEYKDIPVVYGLINPLDSIHYIKVNKAFSGDANALDLAADANNYDYKAGEIDVVVQEWNGDNKLNSYTLMRTTNIPKDAGIFDNSTNVLYSFVEPNINESFTYKLIITNNNLNKEITAQTEIVDTSTVAAPSTGQKFSFFDGDINNNGEYRERIVSVNSGGDIGRVEAILIFNYLDVYTIASGKDSVERSVVISLGEKITPLSAANSNLDWTLQGETFFENIAASVPPMTADLSHRRLDNISLRFEIAGTELSTFMAVSAPSNTINQDKPNYTNITNGIGIFSSRKTQLWTSTFIPLGGLVNITDPTIKYLAFHPSMAGRGFCFNYGTFPVAPCVRQ